MCSNQYPPRPSLIREGDFSYSEGACRSTRQIEFCINFSRHSEALRAERIQPIENNNKLDCFANARNDAMYLFPSREGSANEQRAKRRREGGGVGVPLYASEQDRGLSGG